MADHVALQVDSQKENSTLSEEETSFDRDVGEETPKPSLQEAAESANEDDVLEILKRPSGNADIDGLDGKGWAVLHYAAFRNHSRVITILLQKGADAEVKTSQIRNIDNKKIDIGSTALHLAAREGFVEAVEVLLDLRKHLQCNPENSVHLMPAEVDSEASTRQAAENGNSDEVLEIQQTLSGGARVTTLIDSLDDKGWAALHYAAHNNHLNVVATLLLKGADPNIRTSQKRWMFGGKYIESESTALHVAAKNGHELIVKELLGLSERLQQHESEKSVTLKPADVNATDCYKQTALHIAVVEGSVMMVRYLLEKRAKESINLVDESGKTPLQYAVEKGTVEMASVLLENGATESINHADRWEKTPLQIAVFEGSVVMVKLLLENGARKSINLADDNCRTPLHYAVRDGSMEMVRVLLENGAKESIKRADEFGITALHYAAVGGHVEITRELLDNGARETINQAVKGGQTPVHLACSRGQVELLKILLDDADMEKVDDNGNTPLMTAILEGYEDAVKTILMKFDPATARKHVMMCNKENTTPIREAIRRMPDAAAMMLDCCTQTDAVEAKSSKKYSVTFYCSILEDFQDDVSSHSCVQVQDRALSCFQASAKTVFPDDGGFTADWGPVGFDYKNLPLNLIADSENLKLLKHPLVTYLVKRKWQLARVVYLLGLLFYCIFLTFLTAFSLTAPSPVSGSCHTVSGAANVSVVDDCELSDNRQLFIVTAAIFVLLLALARLMSEAFQMYQHKVHYFIDWINWLELLMAVFSIIFVWVFNRDCLCTYHWQWQIGTVAVFSAWFDFIIFVQKLPTVGIYVAMLRDILWSFIKTIPLAIMLVIAFALGFFMLFSDPGILRSPFSTPARALLSTVAYTAGGFGYNGLFRLSFDGTADSDVEEIPFPPVSYILFIVFIIIMSILLSNLLTALAVGNTEKILRNAEATNIVLKIRLILSVEAILPAKLRRKFIVGEEEVYPNRDLSWMEKLQMKLKLHAALPKGIEVSEILKREDDSLKGLTKKTLTLMKDVQDIKQTMESAVKRDNSLAKKVQDMKQTVEKRYDEIIRSQEELKQSQEEIRKMMCELLQKLP